MAVRVMTEIRGVPDKGEIVPGMAHFAHTGPPGTQCGTCKHFMALAGRSIGSCGKYMQLTRHMAKRGKDFKLDARQPSCRYYEAKR